MLEEEKRDYTVDLTKKLYESIPQIKKKMKFYELDRVKLEIAEEVALAKRVEINMNVEHWKKYFLYPFAPIAPVPDIDDSTISNTSSTEVSESDKNFNKLVSRKYLFPVTCLRKMESSEGCLRELQNPLTVTSDEILRDLLKFLKDFNVDLIPHMNEEEINAYKKEQLRTARMNQHTTNVLANNSSTSETGLLYGNHSSSGGLFGNDQNATPSPNMQQIKMRMLKPTHYDKHQVTSFDILDAFKEIEHEDTARLIGLISHFVYWVVFGHLNS